MPILEAHNIKKIYSTMSGGNKVTALSDVSFSVEAGEFVAIMGESGSGKTTLLNILATLDEPTAGEVKIAGQPLSSIKDSEKARFRRNNLGFIFQDFNLLDNFTLKDNIFLPLVLSGKHHDEMERRIKPIAVKLNIENILDKFPYEVSGGQKQRAAAARAMITNPAIIFADEPTGALDSRASTELLNTLGDINSGGQTILMVTHSVKAASKAKRVLFIKDGRVFHQLYKANMTDDEMFVRISDTLTAISVGGDINE